MDSSAHGYTSYSQHLILHIPPHQPRPPESCFCFHLSHVSCSQGSTVHVLLPGPVRVLFIPIPLSPLSPSNSSSHPTSSMKPAWLIPAPPAYPSLWVFLSPLNTYQTSSPRFSDVDIISNNLSEERTEHSFIFLPNHIRFKNHVE